MKRISALLLCAFGIAFNACEKHSSSELEDAHGAADPHASAAKHAPSATHDAKPAEGAPAHGEAPKFFPEKK